MPSNQKIHSQEKSSHRRIRRRARSDSELTTPNPVSLETVQKAMLEPASLSASEVVHLQRSVGNRAVGSVVRDAQTIQRMALSIVQREGENPLSPAQVAMAIQYYRGRSAQYTDAIIRQIQGGVGVAETGVVDEEMVQAVARYQQVNSPLKVDGMAGPRTLPALFPSGMAEQGAVEAYAAAAREAINGDWAAMSPDDRAQAILDKVNDQATAAGFPVMGKIVHAMDPQTYGQFDFSTWSIEVNQALVSLPTLTEAQATDLADTMYHEGRHGEQWFRMAQLLAGQGKNAAQIATQTGIPNNIAALAEADPIAPGSMEALIADGWFQSVYGTGSAHREHVLGPQGTYIEYRNLPEESDAWRVGSSVRDAYTAGAPEGGGGGETLEMEPITIEGSP